MEKELLKSFLLEDDSWENLPDEEEAEDLEVEEKEETEEEEGEEEF